LRLLQRLLELLEDWVYVIRKDGFGSAIPAIGQDISRLPFRHLRFIVFERPLNETIPEFHPQIELEIRPFEQFDLQMVKSINRPSEALQCERHLESGHKGLIAFYQDQPAGYAWGSADVNPEIEKVPIHLEPGDVLCTDVFTKPQFRGKGVQTALSLARFQIFQDLGFSRAICYIEIQNGPSLAVWQRKLGARKIGTIDLLRIGPWYKIKNC
jgi:GNAT superfamily N-acetyltransferase